MRILPSSSPPFFLPRAITTKTYNTIFEKALQVKKEEGSYRNFIELKRYQGRFPLAYSFAHQKTIEVWCSNDYLGMGQNPVVLKAMKKALQTMGAGAGGTRNISGNHCLLVDLESSLARLHQKEKALVFTSGYLANETCLSALGKLLPECEVFSDAENHASIIQGIKLSGMKKHLFRHNDVQHLQQLLQQSHAPYKLIVFESVYSMDGDICPLREICQVAKAHNALTYLDEVHAVGLYGENGGGVAEKEGLSQEIDIIQGTLGKAFGVVGGYISSSSLIVDAIRSFGSGFIFTTSLPPAIAAGALASIEYVKEHPKIRQALFQKVDRSKKIFHDYGLPLLENQSHILPLLIKDAHRCQSLSQLLLQEHAIFLQPINYPTVKKGLERFRITPTPLHSLKRVKNLAQILSKVLKN